MVCVCFLLGNSDAESRYLDIHWYAAYAAFHVTIHPCNMCSDCFKHVSLLLLVVVVVVAVVVVVVAVVGKVSVVAFVPEMCVSTTDLHFGILGC